MAEHLGRNLLPGEVVHHRNGRRDDNRLENLKLMRIKRHNGNYYALENEYIKDLEERVKHLENLLKGRGG